MKKIFYAFVLLFVCVLAVNAQTTALVTYEGGYFVKNGKEWKEYRPADRNGVWNRYKQFDEDDTYWYVENKKCYVAIPKLYHDKILIDRDKKVKNWEVVYNTLSVHQRCPEPDGLFYSYRNHCKEHGEYDGYYVRDNLTWREYRPRMKSAVWAEFKQVDENDKYFILKSEHNTIHMPKTTDSDIVIYRNGDKNWRGGYAIQAIYDKSAVYGYNFYFENLEKKGTKTVPSTPCRISLDNRCNVQVAFGGRHYDFIYTSVESVDVAGNEDCAVIITIDSRNRIILHGGSALIECKSIGKNISAIGYKATAANSRSLVDELKNGTFNF